MIDHSQARPATENNRNAVYPLVVELAPLSAALPVVVLFEGPQYSQMRSKVMIPHVRDDRSQQGLRETFS